MSGTNFGESARYSCSFGFILQGVSFRVCQIDGTWSNEAPVCVGQFDFIGYCTCIIIIDYCHVLIGK